MPFSNIDDLTVTFVHNGPLYRDFSGQYHGSHITDNLRTRYLMLGGKVNFLMRVKDIEFPDDKYSPIKNKNFSVIEVPDVLKLHGRMANQKKAKSIVYKAVSESDIVVARIPSLIGRWAIKYARNLGKPYMIECVACNWDALYNHKFFFKFLAPYFFIAQRRVIKHAPFVIYVTKSFLQERYPTEGHSFSISNVELSLPEPQALNFRFEKISCLNNGFSTVRLVTVASVSTPYKGQADVIAALSILRNKGLRFEYHLIGGGSPERLKILAKKLGVADQVHFHGAVPHSKIFSTLDDMDLYIQPSKQEGLPRALIEAMSRGLPAIGANTGGIPELLASDRIFPAGNISAISEKIIDLLDLQSLKFEAEKNFHIALQYQSDVINAKRAEVYIAFLEQLGLRSNV